MSDILSIGSSAVAAYQRALGTVSNNIANISTDGYTRQTTNLSAGAPQNLAGIYLGTGVKLDGIKREFSEFVESGLRNSFSGLTTQTPLLQYANRILDVMGGENVSLTPALDKFFASARALSADPSSTDLRSVFLRDADGLASRFRELDSQISGVESDTRAELNDNLSKLGGLANQLAQINAQMRTNSDVAKQSPELLDQRDKVLRDMSKLAGIQVTQKGNGEVSVSLGLSSGEGLIVDGSTARSISASFNDGSAGKVDIVIDPYGHPTTISGINGGTVSGLLSFRQQALEPIQNKLDYLVRSVADAVNEIHRNGVDARGNQGEDLFTIDPVFKLDKLTSTSALGVSFSVLDNASAAYHDIRLRYEDVRDQAASELQGRLVTKLAWTATDLVSGEKAELNPNGITINGMKITVSGTPMDGETMILKAQQRPAAGINVALGDPLKVAVAALFRATANESNLGLSTATVKWDASGAASGGPAALDSVLVNNTVTTAPKTYSNLTSDPTAVATIPAGYSDVALLLNGDYATPADIKVFTRDGRQLAGTALTATQQTSLLQTSNGFVDGSSYSDAYLNLSGDAAYRDTDLFWGARATPAAAQAFEGDNGSSAIASIQTQAIPEISGTGGDVVIAAGALNINGIDLSDLFIPYTENYPDTESLSADDIASWLNEISADSHVEATAANNIRIEAADININDSLTLNGVWISDSFGSVGEMVSAINEAGSGVKAELKRDGSILLSNSGDLPGADILVDDGGAISITDNTTVRGTITLSTASGYEDENIDIGIGSGGSAADLFKLGLRAGVYLSSAMKEDLLVFASADANDAGSAEIAASYVIGESDPIVAQRSESIAITFTDDTHYSITDLTTDTVVAEREYDSSVGIRWGNTLITLSSVPVTGDTFKLDGNHDGLGDNQNMLRLTALEKDRTAIGGRQSIREAYDEGVSTVSNVASQARISQQAMQVVNQQAADARDKASGVNMDTEAADLMRYQQAYQAAAKSIQVANQLFDTLIQIR
jgi:flagellar hook-associated protein FlgK